ncbi:MAG: ATP-dependent helicase, partial [Planctomycetaceae bacterium]|nr:ATP-dependent helicase [Planctomycetaceae bacterium]
MSEIPAQLEELFQQLNPEQQAAACHDQGPLLIIAGAGTGKTTTLSHRVAYLISQGIDPSRILLLTFSRRAANEMIRRVDNLLRALGEGRERTAAAARSRSIWGGTFHSTAARLLRRYGQAIGLPDDFTIIDRSDSEDLMSAIRSEMDLGNGGKKFPRKGTLLEIYSRCVNTCSRLEPILEKHYPWCLEHVDDLKKLFQAFVDRKEKQNILDYDDLLLFWHALAADPAGGKLLRGQFEAILVDEYQDTNVLQSGILKNLSPEGEGLTVVGDDAQSIYSFRAATVRNILDFPQEYPGTTIVTLEENYRSTQPILQATNQIID